MDSEVTIENDDELAVVKMSIESLEDAFMTMIDNHKPNSIFRWSHLNRISGKLVELHTAVEEYETLTKA